MNCVRRRLNTALPAAKEASKDGVILELSLVVIEVLFYAGLEIILSTSGVNVEGTGKLLELRLLLGLESPAECSRGHFVVVQDKRRSTKQTNASRLVSRDPRVHHEADSRRELKYMVYVFKQVIKDARLTWRDKITVMPLQAP